jgi:Asp-tRNA(Asn)/Glu-tRNA(Gln) amidotransferase A subunit family amidase
MKLWSLTQGVEAVRRGKLSAAEWAGQCLSRIDACDDQLKAWAYLDRELALKGAAAIDERLARKENVGPLSGAPIGVKDIFNTVDMPTCMGSPLWKDFTPGNDARAVFYLRQAGALVLGKTVTAEFAVHALGDSLNPYDGARTPGTSSTGSAVAVAAGMVPAALGTQTAGSIMRPASFCGVYGFKPSFGLIPRTGMLKTTDTLDTVGWLARGPADLELLFEALRVKGSNFPLSHAALSDPSRQTVEGRPWRVGLVKTHTWKNAEDYAQKALVEFARRLAGDSRIRLEEVTLDAAFERAHRVHAVIYEKALAYYFKKEFSEHTLISRVFYEMITRGQKLSPEDYQNATREQAELARKLDALFGNYDILLSLSTAGQAPLRDVDEKDDPCLIWTLCGVPVMGVPQFKGPAGLPFGLQVVARRYNDPLLLRFGALLKSKGFIHDAETCWVGEKERVV